MVDAEYLISELFILCCKKPGLPLRQVVGRHLGCSGSAFAPTDGAGSGGHSHFGFRGGGWAAGAGLQDANH